MTHERFEAAKSWTVARILQGNRTVEEWPETYLLLVAAKGQKDSIIGPLIQQLTVRDEVGLRHTSRLVVWERITSGDILFEGKGLHVDDDLFSVAGRANWILRNITGKDFGHVKPSSSAEHLEQLMVKWAQWNDGKEVDGYRNPYETKDKGLEEINSIEALEAIIVSLKWTQGKEALVKDCLKRLYNLDELPGDPETPANFCDPDTYAHMYLAKLTGVGDKHDHGWWAAWWAESKDRLVWDKAKGRFEAGK